MKFVFSLLKDWVNFLYKPRDEPGQYTTGEKIISLIFYILLFLGLSISLSFATGDLMRYLWSKRLIPHPVISRFDFFNIPFFPAVILAPVWEELIFRLNLRFKTWFISFSMIALIFHCLYLFCGFDIFFNLKYTLENLALMILLALVLWPFVMMLETKLEQFWKNHLRVIFYGSAIVFGYLHLTNYYIDHYSIVLLSLFFLFPKVIMGLNLGFIRLRYGIIFSILLHSLNNLTAYLWIQWWLRYGL